ncbi:MAG: hypothetical protein ABH863_05680 [Candidatus Micrarchaeota archaeon]
MPKPIPREKALEIARDSAPQKLLVEKMFETGYAHTSEKIPGWKGSLHGLMRLLTRKLEHEGHAAPFLRIGHEKSSRQSFFYPNPAVFAGVPELPRKRLEVLSSLVPTNRLIVNFLLAHPNSTQSMIHAHLLENRRNIQRRNIGPAIMYVNKALFSHIGVDAVVGVGKASARRFSASVKLARVLGVSAASGDAFLRLSPFAAKVLRLFEGRGELWQSQAAAQLGKRSSDITDALSAINRVFPGLIQRKRYGMHSLLSPNHELAVKHGFSLSRSELVENPWGIHFSSLSEPARDLFGHMTRRMAKPGIEIARDRKLNAGLVDEVLETVGRTHVHESELPENVDRGEILGNLRKPKGVLRINGGNWIRRSVLKNRLDAIALENILLEARKAAPDADLLASQSESLLIKAHRQAPKGTAKDAILAAIRAVEKRQLSRKKRKQ